jgi:response regulator RpfG family c-di-GMP phosphodiesterase
MSFLNGNSFVDRQEAAAKARKAMAEKFLSRPKYDPSDPEVLAREAKRKAILEAREQRDIERAKRRAEEEASEAVRRAADEATRQEQLRLEALARDAEAQQQREELEKLEFEKKLERDARYAARKERKKKKKSAHERYG